MGEVNLHEAGESPEPRWPDEARRCSYQINLHVACGNVGKWAAIRLSDGGSDGIAYDTRADAINHQLHESLCAYVRIPVDGMPPQEAMRYLGAMRAFHDAGFRFVDPEGPEPILPQRQEDLDSLVAGLIGRAEQRGIRR